MLCETVKRRFSRNADECDDTDNETFTCILEDVPGPPSKRFEPKIGYENFISEILAIVSEKM